MLSASIIFSVWLSDIGRLIHLIAGIIYFCSNGFHHVLDYIALTAPAAVIFGVGYIIYLNKIHENEIAAKALKGPWLWCDCLFGTGRSCYRNISGRDICRCFISACVDSNWRLFKFCCGSAHISLI